MKKQRKNPKKGPTLNGTIRRLQRKICKKANLDTYQFHDLVDQWADDPEGDQFMFFGKCRADGTTFSLDGIEVMMANIELWVLCRIAHRWNQTGMTPETAPYDLQMKMEVGFDDA